MTLIEKADALAAKAHEGQTRKEGGTPYITHPRAVAAILRAAGYDDTVVAAALVHDVVEDTSLTIEDVRRGLGDAVAALVACVTHDDALEWEEKKKRYIEAVRIAPEGAKAIAVADKIHNAQSLIAGHETQGSRIWSYFNRSREKKLWFEKAMLAMLRESWQSPLIDEYALLVDRLEQLD